MSWSGKSLGNLIRRLPINVKKKKEKKSKEMKRKPNMKNKIQCKTNKVELYFKSNVNWYVRPGHGKKRKEIVNRWAFNLLHYDFSVLRQRLF